MPELITHETLGPVLEELRLAFRIRIPEKDLGGTVDAWSRGLTGLTVESVQAAARRHIRSGDKFPHVKELRELALDFMARNNATIAPQHRHDPDGCAICGARYEYHDVTRKRVEVIKLANDRVEYREILDEKGLPTWETVRSPRQEIFHDRAAHHLVDSLTA